MNKGDTIFAFKKEQLLQIAIDLKNAESLEKKDSLKQEKINLLSDQISTRDSIITTLILNTKYFETIIANDSTIINSQDIIIENKNKEIKKHIREKRIIAGSGGVIIVILLLVL